jgi:hypothetical protein
VRYAHAWPNYGGIVPAVRSLESFIDVTDEDAARLGDLLF